MHVFYGAGAATGVKKWLVGGRFGLADAAGFVFVDVVEVGGGGWWGDGGSHGGRCGRGVEALEGWERLLHIHLDCGEEQDIRFWRVDVRTRPLFGRSAHL